MYIYLFMYVGQVMRTTGWLFLYIGGRFKGVLGLLSRGLGLM